MIDTIEDIFAVTSAIEDLLKSKGATGSGLKELRLSIKDKLSAKCHNHLKYIGHVRNQVAHDGYKPTVQEYDKLNELYEEILDELNHSFQSNTAWRTEDVNNISHENVKDITEKLIFKSEEFKRLYDITCSIYSSKFYYTTEEKQLSEIENNDIIKEYNKCTFEIDELAKKYCKFKGWAVVLINGEKTKLSYDVVTILLEREKLLKCLETSRMAIIEGSIQRAELINQLPKYLSCYLLDTDSNGLDNKIIDINEKFKNDESINGLDIVAGILTVAFGLFLFSVK
ncbi:hypothetical protein ACX3OY_23530 [Citrobacter farmeri]